MIAIGTVTLQTLRCSPPIRPTHGDSREWGNEDQRMAAHGSRRLDRRHVGHRGCSSGTGSDSWEAPQVGLIATSETRAAEVTFTGEVRWARSGR